MKINPDDSAFPIVIDDVSKNQYAHIGLSKREYFIAVALSGIIQSERYGTFKARAVQAIKQVDALIEELNK